MARASASLRSARTAARLDADGWPLDVADFPGCEEVRITREEYKDYDGRVEYWDSRTETAMVVCEATSFHERPSQRLARLLERIAAASGTVIETFGTTDLVRFFEGDRPRVLMQADQVVYVRPAPAAISSPRVDVDGPYLPDVILEVDYTTDVRRGKLPRYEAWGFPELWVDVPDAPSASRPKSRRSGLTIHLLEDGRFREAPESLAFPGWTAAEIHRALNEPATSGETYLALHRVGRTLGKMAGTGPDDDPWLRHQRDAARAEGRAQGRAEGLEEGRAQGRTDGVLAIVAALLRNRGIGMSSALAARLVEAGDRSPAELLHAAQNCVSAEDLIERLRD